ncbi:GIY-YIG nuclease family protein [Clostridiaceae bacterium M8S5]|nr:GIY-YIG nuclease family protein [Clostridiaceae bacterium M8S5]
MKKTVTYLYPDEYKASNLKMFQDTTSQIRGYYFTKDNINEVFSFMYSKNYAVYFLFDDSVEDESLVYIGQSVNGIERISEHVKAKSFWSYCIMFVTDNNSFDKLTIDYLEYEFINKFKKSSYSLRNKDLRERRPNISVFDEARLNSFIHQIEFLLRAEGINIDTRKEKTNETKYYYPSKTYNAKLFVKDGRFVLEKGSNIKRPNETSKEWKDNFYGRYNNTIDRYLAEGKAIEDDGQIVTCVNLEFKKPSQPAELVSGTSQNGWTFFRGLNELR